MKSSTVEALARQTWERRKRAALALQAPSLVAMRLLKPEPKARKRRGPANQPPLPFGGPDGGSAF